MLSIIIPTHNRPTLLSRALTSALQSLPADAEVIVVNDNTDGAPVTLDTPDTVRVIEGPRIGAAGARNAGADNANKRYILFLDDDDELLPGYSDRVLAAIKTGAKMGYSAFEDPSQNRQASWRARSTGLVPSNAPFRDRVFGAGMGFWIERNTYLDVGGMNTALKIDEDTDLCCRLALTGQPLWFDAKPGVRLSTDDPTQLTTTISRADRANAYQHTLDLNGPSFPAFHPGRWFLLIRYLRRAAKGGYRKQALQVVLRQRPIITIPPALIVWATKSLFSKG